MTTISPIPDGYHSVTPWIIGRDTLALMEFLTAAFDAEPHGEPVVDEQGNVGHAEMRIGDSMVMMFDKPDWPPTPAFLRFYVADIHQTIKQAVAAGARIVTEPTHLFWGDLVARIADPFGNLYWLQMRIEIVDEDEMMRRFGDETFLANMQYVQSALFHPNVG
ncbi:VOC family protein [Pseudonocardia sp. CA-107938]|uniref:VOC family protein n=1 Tax=Pseudonocardia sp. CA-107938 TaxID=3240021 RepID=UPI003D8F9017